MDSSYSLSDIRAATDHDGCGYGYGDGFGGGGILAWFLLFALMGGNGFGWGNRGGNPVTESDLCNANSFNDLKSSVRNVSDQVSGMNIGLTKGLCDFGYTTLEQFNNVEQQIAACCCQTERIALENRYLAAQNTAEINANTTAQVQKVLDALCGNRMADMQNQINSLQLQAALCGIPRTNPYGYGIYAYPTCAGMAGCGCTNI